MKTLRATQVIDRHAPLKDDHFAAYVYEVDSVSNSLTPPIHSRLTPAQMAEYCNDADWRVVIT